LELRAYWTVIWRRIWLIALIVGVVALYVGYQYYHLRKTPGALTAYRSDITIQIGLQASPDSIDTSSAESVAVSETLADAMITSPILSSKEFDTQVSQQIGSDMSLIEQRFSNPHPDLGNWQDTAAIGAALTSVRAHSLVTVSATWPTPAGAWAIANAVGEVSSSSICQYLEYVVSKQASCSPTATSSQPAVAAQVISSATNAVPVPGTSVNRQTLLFILLIVALIVSIALAFLIDYLDDHIRSKDDAVLLLQLPVYGEVPRPPAAGKMKAHRSSSLAT
jgi:capsular polysaccharide biosynthesis protein